MRTKRFSRALLAVAFLSASVAARPAAAQPVLDGGWSQFDWFSVAGGIESPFDAFSLTSANPFVVRVVDCCVIGDQFQLSWTGSAVGSMSTGPFVGDGLQSGQFSGDNAWADPRLSKGSVLLAPGTYDFTLEITRFATGSTNGAGFIDAATSVSAVPEPSTVALVAGGLVALAGVARRRRGG